MELILFLILGAMLAWLWRRVDGLEREVRRLRGAAPAAPLSESVAATASAPDAPQVVELEKRPVGPASAGWSGIAARTGGWRPQVDLEDLFGRMLPIWAGGVTLAVAGFFLVRWSIDAGLLTPRVRVVLAGLFGIALICGAEAAYRWRERVADPRVAQALAGAGLATLYAAFYLAGSAYGLIPSALAFIGLAAVTGAAIALSYRFGLPSAVLGLVGGFAAPALVGSEQANLPLLTLYLALVTAGLALTGRRQERGWLGIAALSGGLGWGAMLVAGGRAGTPDVAVLGAYLVLVGAVVPALAGADGKPHWLVRVGAAGIGALQLAALVQSGGFGALDWGMYLLLGAALAWFGWRQPAMREGSAIAAAVGTALLFFWPAPGAQAFTVICAALAAIFAGVPVAQLARGHGRALDLAQVSGVALGLALAALWHFGSALPETRQPAMALALLALGILPAAASALARSSLSAQHAPWPSVAHGIAALIGFGALAQVLPQDALAWTAALAAAALCWRARTLEGAIATLAVLAALWSVEPLTRWLQAGSLALVGTPMLSDDIQGLRTIALHVLPLVVGAAAWLFAAVPGGAARRALGPVALTAAAIALHTVFRHGFAGLAGPDFVATGVMERAAWEALLLAAAWVLAKRGWHSAALALAGAAFAHFVWFSLGVHNPLWSAQAVGALPLLNALAPAYAAGLAALLLLRRWSPVAVPWLRWVADGAIMAVLALFALSELRQIFAGSLLDRVPVGQGEDLLRSLLGIVLAIAFLLWGARRHERSWRIGSLVLMVMAVLKVFLVDAAGLGGLSRIASFMALGFSLIGIGWFYARQLRGAAPPTRSDGNIATG